MYNTVYVVFLRAAVPHQAVSKWVFGRLLLLKDCLKGEGAMTELYSHTVSIFPDILPDLMSSCWGKNK